MTKQHALPKVLLFAATLAGATLGASAQRTSGELRANAALEQARRSPAAPLAVEAFLRPMPKGADLHMHLSGAIYAETFLRDAAVDHLCADPATLRFVPNTGLPDAATPKCPAGDLPAARAFTDQKLYDALVDSFSMRGFVPTPGVTAHDQFFATFERPSGISPSHLPEWLDEVAARAAAQNEQYLEVMHTPAYRQLAPLWNSLDWTATPTGESADASPAQLAAMRDKLLAGGLRTSIAQNIRDLDSLLAARRQIEHCDTPSPAAACTVEIRFLYQVLRAAPPRQVFAQTLLAFEVAAADPNVAGLNFVQPEDAILAMSEYHRQMLMLDYLHSVYPQVHISLHAGELAPGLVPPAGLRFHIRQAVELGHAERIGHGVDIMYEDDPHALLREMAARHILVEINLTSNDVILGIVPPHHPLPIYLAAHVPVALSTDDEGVSRIDLTHEYVRAALEYNLSYTILKDMARAGLEHSFLPGSSLWSTPDTYTHTAPACAAPLPVATPTPRCAAFLATSEKAAQQYELEHRFQQFESHLP